MRQYLADLFTRASPQEIKQSNSPSGKYLLSWQRYLPKENVFGVSRELVNHSTTGEPIATIDRNFPSFPFSWCENHPNGHDYLICGEDYQGQTIIELDSRRRVDHIPSIAEAGGGSCWAAHYSSPDGKLIFVDGCYWAAPYELVLFDFTDPMNLPYHEFRRWPIWEVKGFQPDGSFLFEYDQEVRKTDGEPVSELTHEERDLLDSVPKLEDAYAEKRLQVRWKPDWTEEVHEVAS